MKNFSQNSIATLKLLQNEIHNIKKPSEALPGQLFQVVAYGN